jgi:hypothetical protein
MDGESGARRERSKWSSGKGIAAILAIAVNLGFIAFLVFSVTWQNRKEAAVSVELYAPPAPAPKVETPKPPEPAPPQPEPPAGASRAATTRTTTAAARAAEAGTESRATGTEQGRDRAEGETRTSRAGAD